MIQTDEEDTSVRRCTGLISSSWTAAAQRRPLQTGPRFCLGRHAVIVILHWIRVFGEQTIALKKKPKRWSQSRTNWTASSPNWLKLTRNRESAEFLVFQSTCTEGRKKKKKLCKSKAVHTRSDPVVPKYNLKYTSDEFEPAAGRSSVSLFCNVWLFFAGLYGRYQGLSSSNSSQLSVLLQSSHEESRCLLKGISAACRGRRWELLAAELSSDRSVSKVPPCCS